eukprot:gene2250-11144_t
MSMVGALAAVHQQPAAAASKAAISTGEAAAFADSLSDLERQFKKRGMGVNEKAILVHCLDSLLQVLNPPSAPKDLEASDLTECVADIFAATAAETNPPEVVVQVSDCFRTASGDFTILISDGKYSTIVRASPTFGRTVLLACNDTRVVRMRLRYMHRAVPGKEVSHIAYDYADVSSTYRNFRRTVGNPMELTAVNGRTNADVLAVCSGNCNEAFVQTIGQDGGWANADYDYDTEAWGNGDEHVGYSVVNGTHQCVVDFVGGFPDTAAAAADCPFVDKPVNQFTPADRRFVNNWWLGTQVFHCVGKGKRCRFADCVTLRNRQLHPNAAHIPYVGFKYAILESQPDPPADPRYLSDGASSASEYDGSSADNGGSDDDYESD